MSWWAYMTADVGGPETLTVEGYEQNVTYNLSGIFRKAFARDFEDGFNDLNGQTGEEAYDKIENALLTIQNNLEDFRDLEPPNKWGTVETAIEVLGQMLLWCHEAPKGIIKIS